MPNGSAARSRLSAFSFSKALCEKGAFDLSFMFVRNVVGQFIVREGGIEASDRARDRIVPRDGALYDRMKHAVRLFDMHVGIHDIVQERG